MKLEMLLTKTAKFTELIRINDFDSTEHCLEVINLFFNIDPNYPYYTENKNEKNYKYVYLTGDGQACFVEQLTEFNCSQDEKSWGVVHSIPMN
jgi:hypothetical protein